MVKQAFAAVLIMCMMALTAEAAEATSISISPASFSLNGFPGETLQKNLTLLTDGNYAVYLSYRIEKNQTAINLTLNHTFPLIVEHNRTVPIQFIIPTDIYPQSFDVILQAQTEQAEIIVLPEPVDPTHGGGGGGSGHWVIGNMSNSTLQGIIRLSPNPASNSSSGNEPDVINLTPPKRANLFIRFIEWLKRVLQAVEKTFKENLNNWVQNGK